MAYKMPTEGNYSSLLHLDKEDKQELARDVLKLIEDRTREKNFGKTTDICGGCSLATVMAVEELMLDELHVFGKDRNDYYSMRADEYAHRASLAPLLSLIGALMLDSRTPYGSPINAYETSDLGSMFDKQAH